MTTPPDQPFGAGVPAFPGGGEPPHGNATPDQPSSIALAVKLMIAGAVLGLLSLVYSLATMGDLKDDIRDELVKDDANVKQSTIDAAYAVSIGVAVVFGLIGAFLWLWMAWKNGQGRSWARIVSTILGAFNVIGLLFTATSGNFEALSLVASVVSAVLAAVILVLLWRPESSRFYEAVSQSRRLA